MADENLGAAAPQPGNAPSMNLVGQYIRDLSFENPGAPGSLLAGGANPAFNVSISTSVKQQNEEIYAVELTLNAKANRDETVLFNVELVYGGIFRLKGFAKEHMLPLLFIECPRMLFPFARQIIADATRNGGFPPLMIDPIDFAQMFQQRMAAERTRAASAPAPQVN